MNNTQQLVADLLSKLETIRFGVTQDVTNNNGAVDLIAIEDTVADAIDLTETVLALVEKEN